MNNSEGPLGAIRLIAQDVLDGKVKAIEGAHLLFPFVVEGGVINSAQTALIKGVVSETVGMPFGEVRRHWNVDALKQQDQLLELAEERWRTKIEEVCRDIVCRV